MVDQHFVREAFEDPRVLQGLERRHSFLWVPSEALHDEVEERLTLVADDLFQWTRPWDAKTTLRVFEGFSWLVRVFLEELAPPRALGQHLL